MDIDTENSGLRGQIEQYATQWDKPSQNKSYLNYISVTRMKTPDSKSRWKNQAHTPRSTSPGAF